MEWETIVGYGVGALILFGLYRLGIRPRGALWIARDAYKERKRQEKIRKQQKENEEYWARERAIRRQIQAELGIKPFPFNHPRK